MSTLFHIFITLATLFHNFFRFFTSFYSLFTPWLGLSLSFYNYCIDLSPLINLSVDTCSQLFYILFTTCCHTFTIDLLCFFLHNFFFYHHPVSMHKPEFSFKKLFIRKFLEALPVCHTFFLAECLFIYFFPCFESLCNIENCGIKLIFFFNTFFPSKKLSQFLYIR